MRLAGRYDGKDDTPDEDDVRPGDRPDYWTLRSLILITIQTFSIIMHREYITICYGKTWRTFPPHWH